ncbi:MAG TPA: NAD(+)/NADH kinase [Pseudobdellovibrionaceae bacterium]|nr:NAD(+)/NADH kinase [Pseudobdellovibrionaceae bacterium]
MAAKTKTKTVAIVYRLQTEKAVFAATELAQWLTSEGHKALTAPSQKALKGAPLMKSAKGFDDVDLVVVLGGDGTYLRAVRLLEGRQVPLLGFNMGSLGFLTVHPASNAPEITKKTLAGKMELRSRAMIHASVRRKGKTRGEFHALNDMVLERGSSSHLLNAAIFLGAHKVSEVKADAFIVSSPTGSTAYNLAAGGPILDPSVRALTVTPVAPHALTTRPLIVPDDVEIVFRLVSGRDQKAHFVVDGQKELELESEDEIVLKRSSFDHLVVREPGFNSYTLLKEKLKFGDRA